MAWEFESDRPIYTQILEQMEKKIISGEYAPGSKLPSVRELAAEAAVNPNTMQRALAELERGGMVVTNRTSGRVVTDDLNVLKKTRDMTAREYTAKYVEKMHDLKYNTDQIVEFIKEGRE